MKRLVLAVAVALAVPLAAVAQTALDPSWGVLDPAAPELNQGPKEAAVADNGMVSTQLMSSTLAAVEVLENGGNAVDAALTALFVQQVHDYHMVFLFGSMSGLVYDAESDSIYALDAIAARPLAGRVEKGDPTKVAIGGTVRGSQALLERFGSLSWAEILAPSIQAAEEGAIVTSFMYGLNFALWESGLLGDLRQSSAARDFYMPDGHLVGVGRRWSMPALAETLKRLAAEGPDYMYTGEWGRKFVQQATEKGNGVTLEDLAEYRAEWLEPVRFTYRGHEIYGSPPPDTGGVEVGFNLNVLENFDLAAMGHYSESAETLEVMARAMYRVRSEVEPATRDPRTWNVPVELWLDRDYGRMGAEYVRQTMPRVSLAPETESEESDETVVAALPPTPELGSDHIVVADRHGNWVSLLHTIHGGAPGVFVDGVRATGSELGGRPVGLGRRLVLPITAIMLTRDGKPWLAMGTPGYPPQPVTEVLVNILDFGMEPSEAVDAPRFWSFGTPARLQALDEKIQLETRISDEVRAGLAERGISIEDLGRYNFHTGSMQIVWRDAEGRLHGSADARRLAYAKGH
jgi:gamma-glutamyltranspeptidase/glutathione hydrolase